MDVTASLLNDEVPSSHRVYHYVGQGSTDKCIQTDQFLRVSGSKLHVPDNAAGF